MGRLDKLAIADSGTSAGNTTKKKSPVTNTIVSDFAQGWKDVFTLKTPFQELLASITVAAVALPLNLALAVASGLPPSVGLLAGAIGGMLASFFAGASLQVTGPAAALNLLVLAIATDFGVTGVAFAALLVGIFQLIAGLLKAGGPAKHIPESVLSGFMAGVGMKLLDGQIPEFLGFNYRVSEIASMLHRPAWLYEVSWGSVVCGLIVVVATLSTQSFKRFPGALVGISVATGISLFLAWDIEKVGAIAIDFKGINWNDFQSLNFGKLFLATLPLAFLASVESLLASSAIDSITKTKKPHNPNLELFAQGIANLGAGLVGSMPVSGVVVRSTVNIQSGGKTRLSGILHGLILLMAALHFGNVIRDIPLAALAGLLCVVGVRLVDYHTVIHLWKESKLQLVAYICALIGTVSGHLMLGLGLGLFIGILANRLQKKNIVDQKENLSGPRKKLTKDLAVMKIFRPFHSEKVDDGGTNWMEQIKERAQVAATAFVHNQASVIGKVVLGKDVHIAAGSSVRADEGSPFYIGDHTNIQDGVVIHALKEKWIEVEGQDWAVYIGQNVSLAHQALIHGPSFIGSNSFVGFKAIVHDSIIGEHCFIGHGAMVIGVKIPAERFVPPGTVVDTLDKVDELPMVQDSHRHFNEEVVDVNRGLARAYMNQRNDLVPVENKIKVNLSEETKWTF